MERFVYTPKGVCSRKIELVLNGDKIALVKFTGGCSGNTQGVASLLKGSMIDDAISRLEGIKCGFKSTSCPDQVAQALLLYKEKKSAGESFESVDENEIG